MSEYFTLEEAMDIMKISRPTIKKLIKEGKLETYRTGGNKGQYRITQNQIDNCIKGVFSESVVESQQVSEA